MATRQVAARTHRLPNPPIAVASIDLPEPLLTFELYDEFLKMGGKVSPYVC